jgi:membrane-bound serine protease (ClpP class)
MTLIEQILATILRPEIAFILLTIGPLAIIYELANPGGFVSGVVGIICLILGLYALGQLPINYAGLGLVVLAFVLFGAEVFTPTHGALTLAGVISLFLGGLLLFDTTELDYRVSIVPVAAVSISLGAIFFFIIGTAVRSLKRKPTTGAEGLIGATGVVKKALAPKGVVFVDGARWQASLINGESLTESGAVEEVEEGALVEVVAVNGLSLKVRKKA